MPTINQAGIPVLSSSQTASIYNVKTDPWAFLIGETAATQATLAVNYLVDVDHVTKVGSLYQTLDFTNSVQNAAKADLAAKGIPLVSQVVSPSATDVSAQLRDLRSAGADGLLVWTYDPQQIATFKGLQLIGWNTPVFGINLASTAIAEAVKGAGLSKVVGYDAKSLTVAKPGDPIPVQAQPFFNALTTVMGTSNYQGNQAIAVFFYDATVVLAQAMNKAKSTQPLLVRKALESGSQFSAAEDTYMFSPSNHTNSEALTLAHMTIMNGADPCPNVCVRASGAK